MKTIARILQITGFCATFIAFAFSLAYTIDPGTCKRVSIGPLGWLLPFGMMALVLGFGAVSRNELSKLAQSGFWLFSSLFFGAEVGLHHFYDYGSFPQKWQNAVSVLTPELRLGDALPALAAFYVDIVQYWMPFVSAVSLLAFVGTLSGKNMKIIPIRDLTETSIGGFILRIAIPVAAFVVGLKALMAGQMTVRGADVSGLSAYLYGSAFVVLGLVLFARPPTEAFIRGDVSRFSLVRLWIGIGLFALLMVTATLSLF